MEGDLIHINEWLLPLSWLYGAGVDIRNTLFDWDILKSATYKVPIVNVGNITVGGTGKTPHIEYLVQVLQKRCKVAVLSRGYKRKSRGYVLAKTDTPMEQIGDEPWQMKQKFPDIYIAVDANRRRGIEHLIADVATRDVQVILLDDAYQHRYVKPDLNILLIDYHRMITDDRLLPAGRLRERPSSKSRANVVIVTKCPHNITPMGFRVIHSALQLKPFQRLFYSTLKYGTMEQLFGTEKMEPATLRKNNTHVLLLTGIGNPQQMEQDLRRYAQHITPLTYSDHHYYGKKEAVVINEKFSQLPKPRLIITTEKDATKLRHLAGLTDEAKQSIYVLPIQVEILRDETTILNELITSYVRKNS